MKKINSILMMAIHILEKIIAVILMAVVIVAGVYLVKDIVEGIRVGFDNALIKTILSDTFNIIIVIEFIRVLVKHTMGMVVEVLIFALARGLIVADEKIWEMTITIVAIVLLFACRKFLFLKDDLKRITDDKNDKKDNE
ncbi:MAG: hypothetical protein IJF94_05130 [Eubacterium sp.]|nr:hypothetical protein [Eubacterium sp.]